MPSGDVAPRCAHLEWGERLAGREQGFCATNGQTGVPLYVREAHDSADICNAFVWDTRVANRRSTHTFRDPRTALRRAQCVCGIAAQHARSIGASAEAAPENGRHNAEGSCSDIHRHDDGRLVRIDVIPVEAAARPETHAAIELLRASV